MAVMGYALANMKTTAEVIVLLCARWSRSKSVRQADDVYPASTHCDSASHRETQFSRYGG